MSQMDISADGLCPKKAIAELFGVTERRVEQLAQKKIIPKAGRGLFDPWPTVQAYIRYLHGLANGAISADTTELNQRMLDAKTREGEAKAALRQIELEQRRGDLIALDEARRQWSARLLEFKAAMLEMPKLAAFRFTDADIRIHVEEELNGFVIETLTRYSRDGIFAVGGGGHAPDAPAPEGGERERVGGRKPRARREGEPPAGAVEDGQDAVSP
jgi:phage terminase Nu1 subunit (DNA packaging protein)